MISHLRKAFIYILLSASGWALGQEQDKQQAAEMVTLAKEMRRASMALDDIRDIMVQAAELDTTNLDANYEAGILHLNTIQKEKAGKFLQRVYRQSPDYRFDLEYYIGLSYQYGIQFKKAIDFYDRYKARFKANPRYRGRQRMSLTETDRRIAECRNGIELIASPKEYRIENLGPEINSEWNDYAPALNLEEDVLIFTSKRSDGNLNENVSPRDNRPYEDIFYATKKEGNWNRAANIGKPVNTPFNDSNIALSPDGKTLYTYHDGDFFTSVLRPDGKWGEPIMMPAPINSDSLENSISVTSDGNTLYFSSKREGGYGGFDLYAATKGSDGKWGNVRNLGPAINTEYDEDGPFIDYTGKLLYFSSMGKKGMGGFDIFRSGLLDPKKNVWSEPENLGYPINTPDDDIYFVGTKDSKRGYYASVREGGYGYLDIYRISIPEFVPKEPALLPLTLEVTVEDAETGQPISGKATLQNASDNSIAAEPVSKDGLQTFFIRSLTRQAYILTVTESGYESNTQNITLDGASKNEVKFNQVVKLKKAPIPIKLLIRVVESSSNKALDAIVTLTSPSSQPVGNSVYREGFYQFDLNADGKEYRIAVEKSGYLFVNQPVYLDIRSSTNGIIEKVITLSKLQPGSVGTLNNIYFDFGSSKIREQSIPELKQLEKILRENPEIHMEIAGHTDNVGSAEFNQYLSEIRAKAIKDFLTVNGISGERITTVGYGESRPLVSNDDEREGRQLNRRVEFRIIK